MTEEIIETPTIENEIAVAEEELAGLQEEIAQRRALLDSLIAKKNADLKHEYAELVKGINQSSVGRANEELKAMRSFTNSVNDINGAMVDYTVKMRHTKVHAGVKK